MNEHNFRNFVPHGDHPRWGKFDFTSHNIYSWAEYGLQNPTLKTMWSTWQKLYQAPYKGITASPPEHDTHDQGKRGQNSIQDGTPHVQENLYHLRSEKAPTAAMVEAALSLLNLANAAGVSDKMRRRVDAPEWRCWSNPEFYFAKEGVRLEEIPGSVVDAVLYLVKCSLSPTGYARALACMRMNGFLGELAQVQHLMNEKSFNFILFGEPSELKPWGWSLWGHHLTLCVLVIADQMVISPIFFGCEPNRIDDGPHAGTVIMDDEMLLATRLFNSLSSKQRDKAVAYDTLDHPDMPEGFPHPADGRTVAGAYQDNIYIPYAGARVCEFDAASQEIVLDLAASFLSFLPLGPLKAKMTDVRKHIPDTWLLWMGKGGSSDVFYFRIHSPVLLCEFDHECGMWLTNSNPGRFHIHSIVRTPNGNDYGKEILRLWKLENPTADLK